MQRLLRVAIACQVDGMLKGLEQDIVYTLPKVKLNSKQVKIVKSWIRRMGKQLIKYDTLSVLNYLLAITEEDVVFEVYKKYDPDLLAIQEMKNGASLARAWEKIHNL